MMRSGSINKSPCLGLMLDNPAPLKRAIAWSVCIAAWAVVWMVAAPAGAQKGAPREKYAGEVIRIDPAAQTIVIITEDQERLTLTAEPRLIRDVKVGNMVEFEKEGPRLKSIRVAEAPSVD